MSNSANHVPMRTCAACRSVRAKREMVRIVRCGGGMVQVDPTGKLPGRGVYLCRQRPCWEAGLKRGSLEHALKTRIMPLDRAGLESYGQSLDEKAG